MEFRIIKSKSRFVSSLVPILRLFLLTIKDKKNKKY